MQKHAIPSSEDEKVLEAQRKYYEKLYTSDPNVNFTLDDIVKEKIPEEMVAASEAPFTTDKIKCAIKKMKNNSCPGSDGIPAEFYKVFWTQIQECLVGMIGTTFDEEILHKMGRRGILNLIPKGDTDT